MPIIFYSIKQFEIQPERTKTRVKQDDLDTLTEVWTGPSDSEDLFVPKVGNVHPDFNLMTVTNSSIKRMPGSVSEVTINYHGKLDSGGAAAYTSVPLNSMYWSEGEVAYQVNSSIGLTVRGSAGYETINQAGIATYSRRYTGRCCQLSYITNRRPTGNATEIGTLQGYLGFQNVWDTFSGFQPGAQIEGGGNPIEQITCTDVRVEDRGDGWYRVTETYQSRMFPQTATIAPSAGGISIGGVSGSAGANWAAQEDAAMKSATAAQQVYYDQQGNPLPNSPPGSAGEQVRIMTGIDPLWGYGAPDSLTAGIASALSDGTGGLSFGSYALAY